MVFYMCVVVINIERDLDSGIYIYNIEFWHNLDFVMWFFKIYVHGFFFLKIKEKLYFETKIISLSHTHIYIYIMHK